MLGRTVLLHFPLERAPGRAILLRFPVSGGLVQESSSFLFQNRVVEQFSFVFLSEEAWQSNSSLCLQSRLGETLLCILTLEDAWLTNSSSVWSRESLLEQFFFRIPLGSAWWNSSSSPSLQRGRGRAIILRFPFSGGLVQQFFFICIYQENPGRPFVLHSPSREGLVEIFFIFQKRLGGHLFIRFWSKEGWIKQSIFIFP